MRASIDLKDRVIVALDLPEVDAARRMVDAIGDAACFYKIGYQLGYAGGLGFVEELRARGCQVFLDLKLHDIGNTVEEGVRSLSELGAALLTVHAYPQTMRAAARGRGNGLKVLGVTVLTSYDEADAREAGYAESVAALVETRTRQAVAAGIDGIVCAPWEAERVRAVLGPDGLIVTPGIRPAGAALGDQKRVMTPAEALRAGIDHIVVGRPITGDAAPRDAARRILDELAQAA